jgi:hypothetical protein
MWPLAACRRCAGRTEEAPPATLGIELGNIASEGEDEDRSPELRAVENQGWGVCMFIYQHACPYVEIADRASRRVRCSSWSRDWVNACGHASSKKIENAATYIVAGSIRQYICLWPFGCMFSKQQLLDLHDFQHAGIFLGILKIRKLKKMGKRMLDITEKNERPSATSKRKYHSLSFFQLWLTLFSERPFDLSNPQKHHCSISPVITFAILS